MTLAENEQSEDRGVSGTIPRAKRSGAMSTSKITNIKPRINFFLNYTTSISLEVLLTTIDNEQLKQLKSI